MNNEMRNGWIDIISKMYKDLHNSERVLHVSKESDKKRERLLNYFNRLEKIHKRVSESMQHQYNFLPMEVQCQNRSLYKRQPLWLLV